MQKTMTVVKISSAAKFHAMHVQTEELIADSRSVMTPSQRVEEKLAACTGFTSVPVRRSDESHAPRRPR